ncbi:unnamed protein product [Didymodactylos carnosus]|uniref:Uncharacterized protein n=1 Tax=Didymodactylos carnosus TaxID=1234261 RepID=A0A814IUD7_9BILA|nr:unnamed protein product [Didymodactylos carnosus]CAF1027330.1 unnamed protein product [Didymodactylos carnosus]CAF3639038.1 unnamed protein product [Didymodactylos carnosus]CAF3798310.1 unnamed protein product [Didymodactylos carnosus]
MLIETMQFGDETNPYASRWSVAEIKDTHTNISVFSRISEEYTDAEHIFEFGRKTASILLQTKAASFLFAVTLILPVLMIGVGVSNLEECPLDPKIPIFVLVGGALASLKILQVMWSQYHRRRNREGLTDEEETSEGANGSVFMQRSISLILFLWFVFGNYCIFKVRFPSYEQTLEDPDNWCKKNVYLIAFISIVYCYALVGLMITLLLIVVCVVHCRHRRAIQIAKVVGS